MLARWLEVFGIRLLVSRQAGRQASRQAGKQASKKEREKEIKQASLFHLSWLTIPARARERLLVVSASRKAQAG